MSPSFKENQYLLTQSYSKNNLNRNTPVIIKSPQNNQLYVLRRIVGVSNGKVKISQGKLIINNQIVNDSSYSSGQTKSGSFLEEDKEIIIPEDSYVVLSDNRESGSDSREWGFIPKENIHSLLLFYYSNCQ